MSSVVGTRSGVSARDDFEIRSESESLYGWVRVIDLPAKNLRLLAADASVIGAASISLGESLMTYQDIVGLIPALRKKMTQALVIGLGAGHMPKLLNERYGMATDTLEIDPAIVRAATDYFGFAPAGRLVVGDARYEIRHLEGPYDLIIHDCFTGGSEPAHLLTVETLTRLRELLSENGILAINFVAFATGPHSDALSSIARTLDQVFPNRSVFISDPGKDFTDFIFLASDRPIDIHAHGLLPEQSQWLEARNFEVDATRGTILTDDYNPLEHLQTAKAEHYRRFLVDLFGTKLFLR